MTTDSVEAFVFDAYGTLYDVQSVAEITEQKFPGHGTAITQIWRLKQLEYTWLRTLMQNYRSFWEVSEESLIYALRALGLEEDQGKVDLLMNKYLHLDPYPDTIDTLRRLQGVPLAILSNGSQGMLDTLLDNTGLRPFFQDAISIDSVQTYKPHPSAYELVEERLGVPPNKVMFVSSNAFDASAAKNFGFQVSWIERVTQHSLAQDIAEQETIGPATMFKILRMQMETLNMEPDFRLKSLGDLPAVIA